MPQKTQYRSAVFCLNTEQQVKANAFVEEMKEKHAEKGTMYTSVELITKFYKGEEYHQDFLAKQSSSRALKMF